MQKRIIEAIIAGLSVLAIGSAVAAVIQVNRLEERVEGHKQLLIEVRSDVKELLRR